MIASTLWDDADPSWATQVRVIDVRRTGWVGLHRAVAALAERDVLICNGAPGFDDRWRDLTAVTAARAARRRFGVVVSDATWRPRSLRHESRAPLLWSAADVATRWLDRRIAGPRSVFCFLSTAEVADFDAAVGHLGARAVFTPFTTQLPAGAAAGPSTAQRRAAPYVFSGGNTLRDYDLLCDALGGLGIPVRVATRHTGRRWPANFEVGPVGHDEFFALAAGAAVGVCALRADVVRSCGQQTYLNLLALRTPVVVNAASGVADHLAGLPGATVTGATDPAAMREAVEALLADDADDVDAAVAAGAAQVADRFSPVAYRQRLVQLARTLEGPQG